MWISCFLVWVLACVAVSGRTEEYCQERHVIIPPSRQCQKPCIIDRDCRSKKKACECDGICGLSCIKNNLMCPPLDAVAHGRLDVQANNHFRSIVKYTCDTWYKLRGNSVRICQGDGSWSGSNPWCEAQDIKGSSPITGACVNPPLVENAVHDGYSFNGSYAPGTTLQYNCMPRYDTDINAIPRAWCVNGGEWKGPSMTCTVARCDTLEDVVNGWVVQAAPNLIGTKATYHCKRGYNLVGWDTRECQKDGTWTGTPSTCAIVTCKRPPEVKNAQYDFDLEQDKYPSGHQVLYSCKLGYFAQGERHAICSQGGSWLGLTLTCSPRSCGYPDELVNGRRAGSDFTYTHTIKYYCDVGFLIRGPSSRTCQADGSWTNRMPWCDAVRCPALIAPMFGRLYGAGRTYGTIIRFDCDDPYKLSGSQERRCQANRSWSGQDARCAAVDCGWPRRFDNGYLNGNITTVGATISFYCRTRTTFDGRALQATCMSNGRWSDPPPTCWGQCQVPILANATLIRGMALAYVNHNTTVEYRCRGGLVPHGGARMRCDNGSWSHIPECGPAPCPDYPPHVQNGLRVFLGQDHGNRAKYKCFPGFKLVGVDNTYLTCEFGQWLPEDARPICEEFYCPNPGTLKNGTVYKKVQNKRFLFKPYIQRIRHGDRLEYECDEGFRLKGPTGATCVDGLWQPSIYEPGSICLKAIHPLFHKLWVPIPNVRG